MFSLINAAESRATNFQKTPPARYTNIHTHDIHIIPIVGLETRDLSTESFAGSRDVRAFMIDLQTFMRKELANRCVMGGDGVGPQRCTS